MISLYASTAELVAALNELSDEDQRMIKFHVKETLTRVLSQAQEGKLAHYNLMAMISSNDRSFHANKELGDTVSMVEDALIHHGAEEILQMIDHMNEAQRHAAIVQQRIINKM